MFQRLSLFSSILLLCAYTSSALAQDVIRFAPLPMENTKVVIKQFKPMLDYLEKELNVKIQIVYQENYTKILEKFQSSEIDMAFLGPLPYVILTQEYQKAKPLVRFLNAKGKDTYSCSLVRLEDSNSAEISGKRIALTQPYSTCGYLSVSHLLKQQGADIEKNRYRYTGSHSEVALGITRGEFDLGGLKTSIGNKFAHLGLEEITKSDPLPGFVLTGNTATLSEALLKGITQAMLKLKPLENPVHLQLTQVWGKNVRFGAVPAKDEDFASVRQKLTGITLPMQGND
ncbi:PhnD/SsuA/transferrin family substrate-binding protein [Candidatus Venteria ishoeyi]|uniref:Phosphate-import protein PhnD n=1 Tax=Candidatus Venteria ishoeyi TaxID=1899563 RepID=A0A1H6F9T2_9GAMM|nr:PhnD/SsuA/transferrin family substrate-binding protein [Candidatus Venteria ishoeyi]MDM8545719.1 PhnD/SsuA/transferrin family substrate-binding protein [Candidatus Venteria ishoeyi]SEH06848.1 Phosphate-import protein PhnD precursor [Candidatus Venteria ishoeyi]